MFLHEVFLLETPLNASEGNNPQGDWISRVYGNIVMDVKLIINEWQFTNYINDQ